MSGTCKQTQWLCRTPMHQKNLNVHKTNCCWTMPSRLPPYSNHPEALRKWESLPPRISGSRSVAQNISFFRADSIYQVNSSASAA